MTGTPAPNGLRRTRCDQFVARHIRQAEIQNDAVETLAIERGQRFGGRAHGGHGDLAAADQIDHCIELGHVVFDQEHVLGAAAGEAQQRIERFGERAFRDGFPRWAIAPESSACCHSSAPEITCTGTSAVTGSALSASNRLQPSESGSPMSSVIASGRKRRASARPCVAVVDTMPLKPRSRANPSRMRAKITSSSMISSTPSEGAIRSRSSSMLASALSSASVRGIGRTMRSCTPPSRRPCAAPSSPRDCARADGRT